MNEAIPAPPSRANTSSQLKLGARPTAETKTPATAGASALNMRV